MHSEIRARLSEYLERDLATEERARIGAHLESCTDCDRELNELRETVSLLRRLPEPTLPAGISERGDAADRARRGPRSARPGLVPARRASRALPRRSRPGSRVCSSSSRRRRRRHAAARAGARRRRGRLGARRARGHPGFDRGQRRSLGGRRATAARVGGPAVTSGFTPAEAYQQYVTQARMEEARAPRADPGVRASAARRRPPELGVARLALRITAERRPRGLAAALSPSRAALAAVAPFRLSELSSHGYPARLSRERA